ncbi:MAG: GYD domain-containing protein [Solirubrobacterales bacterium]
MPKYLVQASYTADGLKGIVQSGGSSRPEAVRQMAEALGGSVEAFYFAFGDADAYVVLDMPDNVSTAAAAMTINASGAVTTKTIVLLTPEEVDQAAEKSVDYRPPGS